MGETISNKIVLEGEAEYKKALGDINSRLRENKSAMKAAAAEYDAAGDSMEAMYRYGDSLERTMQTQNEALGLMSEHLDRVEACYGKNSREANELRTKINNMRVELSKTQTQMRQFEGSMDAAAQTGDDLKAGMDAGSAGLEQVGEAAGRANEDVQELSQSIADTMGKKIIDFAIGKQALTTLSDGLKWAMGEAIDGIADQNKTRAITNTDAVTAAMLVRVQDAVKRQFAQYISDEQARGLIGDLWTGMGINGYVPTEAEMTRLAPQIYGVSLAKGIDATTLINSAQTLKTEFGEDWQRSIDLLDTLGAATVGHTQEAISAMGTYSEAFKQAGYDADDMFSIMISGAQEFGVEKLGDLGKNLATFEKNLTGGSKEVEKALKQLDLLTLDLPDKFQEGGEAAETAFSLILTRILSIEDKAKQADIAKAFFGDMNWTKNGADMAQLFLQGFNNEMEVSGQAQRTAEAWGDTLGNNVAGLKERMGQAVGSMAEPLLDGLNDGLKEVNRIIDEETDGTVTGILSKFQEISDESDRQENEAINQWFGQWLDGLVQGTKEKLQGTTQGAAEAMSTATADLYAQLEALDEQINAAWMNGDNVEALTLEGQKQQLIDEIAAVKQEVMDGFGDVGTEAATSLGGKAEDMRTAGETLTGEAVGAVTDAQTDMQTAGETLGGEGVTGLEDGLSGMRDASMSAVDGAVAELYGGVSRAYAAGQATGKAYARGYKSALGIASPSRVMREAAQDTVSPLFDEFEQDRARLYEAAAGLAQAVSEGYGDSAALRAEAPQSGAQAAGGADVETMAQAMQKAMSGMAFELDGSRFAVLIEPGVSRATQQRAMATVRGQGAAARSW